MKKRHKIASHSFEAMIHLLHSPGPIKKEKKKSNYIAEKKKIHQHHNEHEACFLRSNFFVVLLVECKLHLYFTGIQHVNKEFHCVSGNFFAVFSVSFFPSRTLFIFFSIFEHACSRIKDSEAHKLNAIKVY